jgi:hypothetical protein
MGDSVVRDFMEKTKLMKGAAAMSVLQRHQSRAANLPPPVILLSESERWMCRRSFEYVNEG